MKLNRLTEFSRISFYFRCYLEPIPVTPEPPLKRPTHLDLMPITNFSPKKSPIVSAATFSLVFFYYWKIVIH